MSSKDKKVHWICNFFTAIRERIKRILFVSFLTFICIFIFVIFYKIKNDFSLSDYAYNFSINKLLHWKWGVWSDIVDPVITIVTVSLAIILGAYQIYKEWEECLDKRLTVFFIHSFDPNNKMTLEEISNNDLQKLKDELDNIKKKESKEFKSKAELINKIESKMFYSNNKLDEKKSYCLMLCQEAFLAHEGDMRNWAQQLGTQMADQPFLKFYPFFNIVQSKEIIKKNTIDGRKTKQYFLFFFLKDIPNKIFDSNKMVFVDDNYENSPTAIFKETEIKEIDFNTIKSYQDVINFIGNLKT